MDKTYDCAGWATRANMLCSDGRTIRKNAFEECDGKIVPLVWNHEHNDPNAVLGHALLKNRDDGVYAYLTFNDTDAGQNAKLLVQHKDVDRLSIWANKLKQMGSDVIHGVIREVSLVLAGANPGAVIDTVLMHGDDSDEEGIIYSGDFIDDIEPLFHADEDKKGDNSQMANEPKNASGNDKTIADVYDAMTDEQKKAVQAMIGMAITDAKKENQKKKEAQEKLDNQEKPNNTVKHADDSKEKSEDDNLYIQDVVNTFTPTQKKVVQALIGMALADAEADDDDSSDDNSDDDNKKGGNKGMMKHNVFDEETDNMDVLSHSEMMELAKTIAEDTKRYGSMKEAFLQHGITNIDYLFPDAQNVNDTPEFIKRDDTWVSEVMNGVHNTPFSRIKSVFADITEDDARAKGYIKGNQKVDEVFKLLKRVTTPTTVYKKQKLERDDLVDIVDFDVVSWIKQEMRMTLNEEIARAILVGDGRNSSSTDKINEQNIRPIWTDEDVYTVKASVKIQKATTDSEKAEAFIKACIKSRKSYKGTGNPDMFMSEDMLTDCLLLEDKNGRVIYDTIEKLATALRVRRIIPVPIMEDLSRVSGANTHLLGGIYVNLTDYNVGADKGGAVSMFDDFDIDYNAQKYLIETRCSGALIKPYSAVAIEFVIKTEELTAEELAA